MSFGTEARKVRDRGLPYGRRINALAGCVERYEPLGYQATFAYLGHAAGPFRRDEDALLRAIDLLAASRQLWLADLEAYARHRREAKRRGHRQPARVRVSPVAPSGWYGDRRGAALFTIGYLLRRNDKGRFNRVQRADPEVLDLAAACVGTDGHADPVRVAELRTRYERLRDTTHHVNAAWWLALDSLWLLHLIADAQDSLGG